MFSRRVPRDLRPNAIARLRGEKSGVQFDLTVSNPTACGIGYPEGLLTPLAAAEALAYRPDPLGLATARRAVAADYRRRGVEVDPEAIVLTASTSEAYSFLFKLLCDPGDSVLVPAPSYPLFEHLAALDGVECRPYALDPDAGFAPVVPPLDGKPPRALLAVHPNNPTGTYLDVAAVSDLVRACERWGAALVVDEVFHDYSLDRREGAGVDPPAPSLAGTREALTFALGGLSKLVGLPQLKLAWTVVSGPRDLAEEAIARLAFIGDSYLSVSTPVQLALERLLEEGAAIRAAIRERCLANLAALERAVSPASGVSVLPPQGGWSVVLRFPAVVDEEELAIELLERDGVGIHPGYFFDFPEEGYLALSLLPPPEIFSEGARRLLERIASRLRA